MVLATPASFLRCAHCSVRGLCARLVARGCDIECVEDGHVTFRAIEPCEHIRERRIETSRVFAETPGQTRVFPLAAKLLVPPSESSLYAVPLECGAVYHVCENSKNDFIVVMGRRSSARSPAASSLRLGHEVGGFLLSKVAFERARGAQPALAIIFTGSEISDVLGRGDVFQDRPLCYVSAVSPSVTLDPVPPDADADALDKIAREFFVGGGVLPLSVGGKRQDVRLDALSEDLPNGARVWLTTVSARVAAAHIASAASSACATKGWRADPSHWGEHAGAPANGLFRTAMRDSTTQFTGFTAYALLGTSPPHLLARPGGPLVLDPATVLASPAPFLYEFPVKCGKQHVGTYRVAVNGRASDYVVYRGTAVTPQGWWVACKAVDGITTRTHHIDGITFEAGDSGDKPLRFAILRQSEKQRHPIFDDTMYEARRSKKKTSASDWRKRKRAARS